MSYTSDIRVVAIDETQFWKKDIVDACGGQIKTVYIYDASVQTNLCEIRPSYYLTPLYAVPLGEISDETDEILRNSTALDGDEMYVLCCVIDGMETIETKQDFDFEDSDSDEYKEEFEVAREYADCNHLIY